MPPTSKEKLPTFDTISSVLHVGERKVQLFSPNEPKNAQHLININGPYFIRNPPPTSLQLIISLTRSSTTYFEREDEILFSFLT